MQDPVFIDTSEGKVLVADSLKKQDSVNNNERSITKSKEKSILKSTPDKDSQVIEEKKQSNKVTPVNNIETRRGNVEENLFLYYYTVNIFFICFIYRCESLYGTQKFN